MGVSKMKKLIVLAILMASLGLAQDPPQPTAEEKLTIVEQLNIFNKSRVEILEAQERMNNAAMLATQKKVELEKKYNCTYNFNTNVCTPNTKEK